MLSYIDTDCRLQEVLGYVRNTTGLSVLVSFILICRADRVGAQGKCAAGQDLLEQTGLCESQVFFVDGSNQILEDFNEQTPQISVAHIKLARKPAAGRSVAQAKSLVYPNQQPIGPDLCMEFMQCKRHRRTKLHNCRIRSLGHHQSLGLFNPRLALRCYHSF